MRDRPRDHQRDRSGRAAAERGAGDSNCESTAHDGRRVILAQGGESVMLQQEERTEEEYLRERLRALQAKMDLRKLRMMFHFAVRLI